MAEVQEVAIRFTEPTAFGDYSDVLYYPFATFGTVTRGQINAAKTARINAWLAIRQNPPAPQTPPRREYLSYIEELRRTIRQHEIELQANHGARTEPELRARINSLQDELDEFKQQYHTLYGEF